MQARAGQMPGMRTPHRQQLQSRFPALSNGAVAAVRSTPQPTKTRKLLTLSTPHPWAAEGDALVSSWNSAPQRELIPALGQGRWAQVSEQLPDLP